MRKDYIALDRKVLAVAIEGSVKDWAAYIGSVDGENHGMEAEEVRRSGSKLPREIAEYLFPYFAKRFRWRR